MPLYLTRFGYTPQTWARLIENPEDRRQAAQTYIESVGGRLHGFWYAFGPHDGYTLWEAPDNVCGARLLQPGGSVGRQESRRRHEAQGGSEAQKSQEEGREWQGCTSSP